MARAEPTKSGKMMFELSCHAKVNLSLEVLGRRPDGYHELRTLMHEIDLHDQIVVSLSPDGEDHLEVEGMDLGDAKQNLIILGLQALRVDGYHIPSLSMNLMKRIPIGGGLGGGSSDVVGLLVGLAQEFNIPGSVVDSVAAQLGSDTNFFIRGGSAWCYGRGEVIMPTEHTMNHFNLILPAWGCSTPKVFSHLQMPPLPDHCVAFEQGGAFDMGHNDLEEPCIQAYPEMGNLLFGLREKGFDAFLSGSGSTLFTCHGDVSSRDREHAQLNPFCEGMRVIASSSYFRP